ncbi:hypothetical protein P7L78_09205 [Tistrella bauzanensis]|uniref:hypothetical protein n=1 Tax=Tistrella TaxID=171436 RepID=UPI0031F6E8B0
MKRWTKLAVLHKVETTEQTDATPAVADAIIGKNVSFTALQADRKSRDLILPYLGNQGVLLSNAYGRLEMDVELAGSGTAGTAPRWGSLMRVCGFAETATAGTDVTYTLAEDGAETGSLYFVMDRQRHVLLGGRATATWTLSRNDIPTIRVTYTGILGTITDIASMPAVSASAWTVPAVVEKTQTTLSLHSVAQVAESATIQLGNAITYRDMIGDERVLITSRSTTGTVVVQAPDLGDLDVFGLSRSRARGPLAIQHGTAAGNIIEIDAPAVEIGAPTIGQTDNIVNYSLELDVCPVDGLDDLTITVR